MSDVPQNRYDNAQPFLLPVRCRAFTPPAVSHPSGDANVLQPPAYGSCCACGYFRPCTKALNIQHCSANMPATTTTHAYIRFVGSFVAVPASMPQQTTTCSAIPALPPHHANASTLLNAHHTVRTTIPQRCHGTACNPTVHPAHVLPRCREHSNAPHRANPQRCHGTVCSPTAPAAPAAERVHVIAIGPNNSCPARHNSAGGQPNTTVRPT